MERRLRLRDRRVFARSKQAGRTHRHPLVMISVLPNDLPYNRYGFITGKALGNAVVRNRARRLLREGIRQLHPRLCSGVDIILIARPAMVGISYAEVLSSLSNLVERAGLLAREAP